MKTQKDFKDLEKANAYVGEINTAFDAATAAHKTEVANGATLQKSLNEALATVAELSGKLDLQEKHGKDGANIVTINKKNYKLVGNNFVTANGVLTAAQVVKDKALLANLLEIGSGSLVEIEN